MLFAFAAHADVVHLIDDPNEAIHLRMHLIEDAKEEIKISYFIFAKDDTAMEVLALLRQKAREGVKVHLILDEMFNEIPKSIATHLAQEQVEIKNFNQFNILKPGRSIKYRMHDKMLIVDGKYLVMGGRNIEDTYYGRAEKNYHDRDILIEGSLPQMAGSYFNELWQAQHLSAPKETHKKIEEASLVLDQHYENYLETRQELKLEDLQNKAINIEHLDLFHDEVRLKKKPHTGTSHHLYELMSKAQESITIDSPYLIITEEMKTVLSEAIARGVHVRILTNSLKSTDGLLPQAAYLSQRKNIVSMGVELYEYFGDESFHSKSLVIDEEIAIIGSYNFDPRSQNLNSETLGIFFDPALAHLLKTSMDETLKVSLRIDEKGHPIGESKVYPGVSLGKLVTTKLIQYLVAPLILELL